MQKLLAISVGNSRTVVGHFQASTLQGHDHLDNADLKAVVQGIERHWKSLDDTDAMVVLASVNGEVADKLLPEIEAATGAEVHRIRRDLPIPIGTCVDDD